MEVLFSQRNAIYYLEHCRIIVKDSILSFVKKDKGVSKYWSIPYANVAVLLLGSGTSLTQQAARILATEGVMVAFSSGDGVQLYMASQSEYREPQYLQAWYSKWQDMANRLNIAKTFQHQRIKNVTQSWHKLKSEYELPLEKLESINQKYTEQILNAKSTQELMGYEGNYTKSLYAALAKVKNISFSREQQSDDLINRNLDQANYLAYGLAACVLWVLGIPHCFPVSHGLTRRGALVFDVADLIKDACILPIAFSCGVDGIIGMDLRKKCIAYLEDFKALEKMFNTIKGVLHAGNDCE